MNTFHLKILACDKVFYDGQAEIFVFPAYDGEMAIMANHEQMTSTIEIGEVRFRTDKGKEIKAIVSDGLIEVEGNNVTVIVFSAERPQDIDKFRAEAALERAREQLSAKQSIEEYHISRASLARAMARLKGAEDYKD